MLFPDRQILLYFVIPIRAKYLVILYGFIELVSAAGGIRTAWRASPTGGMLWGLSISSPSASPTRCVGGGARGKAAERRRLQGERSGAGRPEQERRHLDKISREAWRISKRAQVLEDAARRSREGRG
jgi:hypothetical protein